MHGFKVQKALRMIFEAYPNEDQKKPELFHYIRVLNFLYINNYSEEIQIAGLLHDALEDTSMTYESIERIFGNHVAQIVQANTKNLNLSKLEALKDIVMRCTQYSQDALIVKMADVYDNFLYYVKDENISEIERCKRIAGYIKKYKQDIWDDVIFDKINEIEKY